MGSDLRTVLDANFAATSPRARALQALTHCPSAVESARATGLRRRLVAAEEAFSQALEDADEFIARVG